MHVSIRIKGHLDPSWQERLEGLQIVHEPDGTTVLSGRLTDQAALYGLLIKLNQLSLSLLALHSNEPMDHGPSGRKGTSKMAQHNDIQTPLPASKGTPTGVATGRVAGAAGAGPEHQRLQVFLGKWINEGYTVASADASSVKILTSDVYEWMPGGFFVLHTAYGRIGDLDVGGVEIIGYDAASQTYRTHFFDSQGHISSQELTANGDSWRWSGEQTRCTAIFTSQGKTQTAYHERLDEQGNWILSMEVTLTKVE